MAETKADSLESVLINALLPKTTRQTTNTGPLSQTTKGNLNQLQLQDLIEQGVSPLLGQLHSGGININNSSALQLGARQIAGNIIAQNAGQTTNVAGSTNTVESTTSSLTQGGDEFVRALLTGSVGLLGAGGLLKVLGGDKSSATSIAGILEGLGKSGNSILDLLKGGRTSTVGFGDDTAENADLGDSLDELIRNYSPQSTQTDPIEDEIQRLLKRQPIDYGYGEG